MPLDPAQVIAVLDDSKRLAAVRHLASLAAPVAQIEAELRALAQTVGGETTLCAATYLDGEEQHFIATSDGPMEPLERHISHCQYVIATGAWICLNDAATPVGPLLKVRRAILRGEPIAAYLGFPLYYDGEVVGAVCAADMQTRTWTPQEHYAVYRSSITIRDILAKA